MFCGAPALNASSWCEHHQRIAFPHYGKPAARLRSPRTTVTLENSMRMVIGMLRQQQETWARAARA
jgi:hypothetical protein